MQTQTAQKFTRADYMNGKVSHANYYSQFVTPEIKVLVQDRIGLAVIQRSTDEHFNDISLRAWDRVALRFPGEPYRTLPILQTAGDNSLATAVCILKQAARIIKQENEG